MRLGSFTRVLFSAVFLFSVSALAINNGPDGRFPLHPDPTMTPGDLCTSGVTKRYPEGIRYCQRDVDRDLKRDLFRRYDVQLGYETQQMPRGDFKIDHFIPLCAGGSNDADNLWPQHKSVYDITDPMEPLVCEKMSEGVLKQAEAVQLIRRAKLDLKQVPAVMKYLNSLH
jgi:hypothetical protein